MIYFTDGTKENFLTAFLLAYRDEEALLASSKTQLVLGQECVFVKTDLLRAKKAEARLAALDGGCLRELSLLLRSGDARREQIAFAYLKFLTEMQRPVRGMLAESAVLDAIKCLEAVTLEIHRMHGFVRFLECGSGALYAPIAPVHDICDLLVPHFRARFPEFPFVLHDVPRKKAAVYDGKNAFTAPLERAEIVLSADEKEWQALWRRYYRSVNIPSRERLKQMRAELPLRYRPFMTEFL